MEQMRSVPRDSGADHVADIRNTPKNERLLVVIILVLVRHQSESRGISW